MPKYVIEREVPGAANLTAEELQGIAQTSKNLSNLHLFTNAADRC